MHIIPLLTSNKFARVRSLEGLVFATPEPMKNRGFGQLIPLVIVLGLLGSVVVQAAEKSHPIYDVFWFEGKDGAKRSIALPHREGHGVGPFNQYVVTISPTIKAAEAAKAEKRAAKKAAKEAAAKGATEAAAEAKAIKAPAALKKAGKVAGVLVGAELTLRALQLLTDGSIGTAGASDYAAGSIIDLRTGKTVGAIQANADAAAATSTVEMLPAH